MKFCKTCKALCLGGEMSQTGCKHKLADINDINEPIQLCVIGGFERTMLTGLLKDKGIPFLEENVQPQGVANEIVTGYDVKLNNISLLVPFSALPEASELLGSLETVNNRIEPHLDEINAEIEHIKTASAAQDKPMSPALRTTVKLLSVIALLIAIALVVFGTDALTSWIKSLF